MSCSNPSNCICVDVHAQGLFPAPPPGRSSTLLVLKERGKRRSMRIMCIFLLPFQVAQVEQGLCIRGSHGRPGCRVPMRAGVPAYRRRHPAARHRTARQRPAWPRAAASLPVSPPNAEPAPRPPLRPGHLPYHLCRVHCWLPEPFSLRLHGPPPPVPALAWSPIESVVDA